MSIDPASWVAGAAAAPISKPPAASSGAGKSVGPTAGQANECQAAADREGDGPLPYRPPEADGKPQPSKSRDASGTRGTRLDLTG